MTSTSQAPHHQPATLPSPQPSPSSIRARFRARMEAIARSRFALAAMMGLSFADACVSPILPEVLYVPMILLHPEKRYFYAFWCSAASVLGGMAGYWLGFFLWEHGLREFAFAHLPGFTPEFFVKVSNWYGGQAFLWVWMGGFTPLPYKIFTVLAGVCHADVDFGTFLLASLLSRFPRIYLTVWILDRLGPPVFEFMNKQLSRVVLVLLLIVLGIVLWRQFG